PGGPRLLAREDRRQLRARHAEGGRQLSAGLEAKPGWNTGREDARRSYEGSRQQRIAAKRAPARWSQWAGGPRPLQPMATMRTIIRVPSYGSTATPERQRSRRGPSPVLAVASSARRGRAGSYWPSPRMRRCL